MELIKYILPSTIFILSLFFMFRKDTTRRYRTRSHRIIKSCKYYKLEDNLEVLAFNKRFSAKGFRWVLQKKYNYTKRLLYAIYERIIDNSNIIFVIFGTPNSGKSEGGQTLAFYIRYMFWKYLGINITIHTAFSTADFQDILPEMELGSVGLKDESTDLSGFGSKNVQKYLDNITKAIRQEQNSFIFIDPTLLEPKVVSYYLETAGKNKRTRKIRFILYDKNNDILGHIYLPLHWCGRFRKRYKEDKTINLSDLKATAGMKTPDISAKKLQKHTDILLKECSRMGVKRKDEIWSVIVFYNGKQARAKNKIAGDTHYMGVLISNVFREIRLGINNIRLREATDKFLNINFVNGENFSDFCFKNIEDENIAKVAQGLARGDSLRAIQNNYPKLGYYYVQKMSNYLRNVNSDSNLGFLFERWFALKEGVPKHKLREVLGGATSKPDLLLNGNIYSLKFRLDLKASSLKFQQSTDLGPEYRYAKENKTTYKLVFMNPAWSLKIQVIKIDPIKDPEEIIVRKHKPRKKLDM